MLTAIYVFFFNYWKNIRLEIYEINFSLKFPSRYLLNWTTFTPIFIFLYSNLHIIYTTYLQRGTVSFRHISLFTLVILFIVGQSVQIVIFLIDLYNTNGFRSLLTPNLQKAMLQVLFGILFIQLIGLSVYGITINPLLGTLALVTTVNFYILIVFLTKGLPRQHSQKTMQSTSIL